MNRFKQAYETAFRESVATHPEEYPHLREDTVIYGNLGVTVWEKVTIESSTAKMFAAMDRGSYNKDGRTFRAACRALGIKHTYAAINAVLAEGD